MTPETREYMERELTRLKEIVSGPPFEIRDKLRALIAKLETLLK